MEHLKHPRRRRHEERHENLERWIISYADFMTLLFATFVMLYAISSVNVSKYRILQQVFAEAFLGKMVHEDSDLAPAQSGPFNHLPAPIPVPPRNLSPELQRQIQHRIEQLEKLYNRLSTQFQGLIQKDLVHIVRQPNGVVIDINATLLFASGSATLTPDALTIIDQVGKALADVPYMVQVNGFTDTVPIHNSQFDSNWDLSATRAISVVKRFVADGIAPDRLVGAGYGEYHPVKANDSPDNMARNRRVSIVVVAPDHEEKVGGVPLLGGARSPAATPAPVPTPTPSPPSAPASGPSTPPAASKTP
ncbi:MAG: OmpA family protein [Alphaproteobacteria bacterium]|nr:OmpA family protein [Alphaproteobacteria bacterium]